MNLRDAMGAEKQPAGFSRRCNGRNCPQVEKLAQERDEPRNTPNTRKANGEEVWIPRLSRLARLIPLAIGCGVGAHWASSLCGKRRTAHCAASSLWLAIAWAALPAPARAELLVVTNGQRFVGTVVQVTKDSVVFESEPGGSLTFPRAQVREIQFTPPAEPPGTSPGPEHQAPSSNQLPTINSQLSTNAWLPPSLGHDNLDWIQLQSGSWISGRFKYLQYPKTGV